jgi:hypothetical protein
MRTMTKISKIDKLPSAFEPHEHKDGGGGEA